LREDTSIPVAEVLSIDETLKMAEDDKFDLVIIDTPPHTAPVVTKIAEAVDYAVCKFCRGLK
jgi:cellulose biosynthesis protein BcsQ